MAKEEWMGSSEKVSMIQRCQLSWVFRTDFAVSFSSSLLSFQMAQRMKGPAMPKAALQAMISAGGTSSRLHFSVDSVGSSELWSVLALSFSGWGAGSCIACCV